MAKLSRLSFPIVVEKVAALTRLQRILICVSACLIMGGVYFYLIYLPKSGRINELKINCDDLQIKLARAKASAKNFDKYQKEYKEAQVKFKLVLQLLPDKKEIPGLLESISKSGRHSGLEFLLFKPDKEVSKGFYAGIPVNIEVTGGYHSLAMFFDRVAKLSRIVNISNITIKSVEGSKTGHLKASCVATTYRFVEPSKAKPAKGKSKKAKGKKKG